MEIYLILEIAFIFICPILSKITDNEYRMYDGLEQKIDNPVINKTYYFTIEVFLNDKINIITSFSNIINNNYNLFSIYFYESQSYYPYRDYKNKDSITLSNININITNNSFYISRIINDTDINFLTYELTPKYSIDYFSVKIEITNSKLKTYYIIMSIFLFFYCIVFFWIVHILINCYRKSHSYPLIKYEPIQQSI